MFFDCLFIEELSRFEIELIFGQIISKPAFEQGKIAATRLKR